MVALGNLHKSQMATCLRMLYKRPLMGFHLCFVLDFYIIQGHVKFKMAVQRRLENITVTPSSSFRLKCEMKAFKKQLVNERTKVGCL